MVEALGDALVGREFAPCFVIKLGASFFTDLDQHVFHKFQVNLLKTCEQLFNAGHYRLAEDLGVAIVVIDLSFGKF